MELGTPQLRREEEKLRREREIYISGMKAESQRRLLLMGEAQRGKKVSIPELGLGMNSDSHSFKPRKLDFQESTSFFLLWIFIIFLNIFCLNYNDAQDDRISCS